MMRIDKDGENLSTSMLPSSTVELLWSLTKAKLIILAMDRYNHDYKVDDLVTDIAIESLLRTSIFYADSSPRGNQQLCLKNLDYTFDSYGLVRLRSTYIFNHTPNTSIILDRLYDSISALLASNMPTDVTMEPNIQGN